MGWAVVFFGMWFGGAADEQERGETWSAEHGCADGSPGENAAAQELEFCHSLPIMVQTMLPGALLRVLGSGIF